MKKRIIIAMTVILSVLLLASCSSSDASVLPSIDDIKYVKITQDDQVIEKTDAEWVSGLLEKIKETGLQKTNSEEKLPETEDYTTLEFIFDDEDINVAYIYQSEGTWYLELPYQGIFIIDGTVGAYVTEVFTETVQ